MTYKFVLNNKFTKHPQRKNCKYDKVFPLEVSKNTNPANQGLPRLTTNAKIFSVVNLTDCQAV